MFRLTNFPVVVLGYILSPALAGSDGSAASFRKKENRRTTPAALTWVSSWALR